MPSQPTSLSDAVQQIVDREREKARRIRRERFHQRLESFRIRLGPIARALVWLQMLLPLIILVGFVLPERAWMLLGELQPVVDILGTYCILSPPLVTLLSAASQLPAEAKGRLIIATWVIGIGFPFAIRASFM